MANVETKSQPIVVAEAKSQPANKAADNQTVASNHKSAPSLPAASTSRANALSSSVIPPVGAGTNSGKPTIVVLDSEPPAARSPRPLLKPVSGGVLNGKALSLPSPSYPDVARRSRIAGIVTVDVVLDENGRVISAQTTNGPPILRDAAIQAALKARFSATMLSGQPVKVAGVITYKFSLVQ
jgi:TonB family protein